MTILGVSIVRNEADIVRINVLHHLALGIDRFLIVDNGSSDGTDRVLRELGADRRIRWTRDDGPYRQSEITTELAREAVREGARWVLPIDADEFWWAFGGDLRRLLDDSAAGALRAQVLNFVQKRDQVDSSPDALLSMTKRTPLPIGPLERVRERVESGRFAYVEMMYQPKWIFRPSASVEIAMGNHAVGGVDGPAMDTGDIVCFHAILRSRAALEAKVEQGARVEELGLDSNQGWHVRRWKRLAETGDLEREWRANSYEGDFLDVYGVPHRVVFDPRLRNLVRPWILSSPEEKARITRRPSRRPETADPAVEEVGRLLETVHEQISTHVTEQNAAETLLQNEVGSRDEIIRAMNAELYEKVGERDGLIRALQEELHGKVDERDRMIRELQAELHSKVAERDAIIHELQARMEESSRAPQEAPNDGNNLRAAWDLAREVIATGRMEKASLAEAMGAVAEGLDRIGKMEEDLVATRERVEDDLSAARTRLEMVESGLRREIDREKNLEERGKDLERQLRDTRLELQRQASLERRLHAAEADVARYTEDRRLLEEEVARLRPLERAVEELRGVRDLLNSTEKHRREAEVAALKASEELVRIHRSRLWKVGCLYWRIMRSLRRLASPDASQGVESLSPSAAPAPGVQATVEPGVGDPLEASYSTGQVAVPPPQAAPAQNAAQTSRTDVEPPPSPVFLASHPPPESNDLGQNRRLTRGNRFDVVCLPIIDWKFRFQRPQQLMCRFAETGHRVFYVAPWVRTSGALYEVSQPRKNVFELSLRGPELNVYTDFLDDEARDTLMEAIDALRRDYGLATTVMFVQLPFWIRLATDAREKYSWPIVYDCMDHHAGFSTNHEEMVAQEQLLFESANLVLTTSAELERTAARYNSNPLLLRNGCDFMHFAGAAAQNGARPVIGYYGAIADWFDSDLVADLAERRPEWDFVLVGDTFTADVERLRSLRNVRLVGEKPYSEIPQWLGGFDVAIIPFKRNPLTEATNPVKAYEILAAGKTLVSVPLPEMVLLGPLVRLASDAEEFDAEISAALTASDWRVVAERRSFARENTWEHRWATLAPRVRAVFPRVSIVVVTYNNLDLTRRCLESIYAHTEWPNFEVLVVDNASADGTPDYLGGASTSYPDLRMFLNPENAGFARASNLGLREASGDYFVLLNNDTVVARGWLSALIGHLQRDPRIGIIGPVTNAIGNEAMIPVGYEDVERMPEWAASLVWEHDREIFDIPMLAMFCVALRRSTFDTVGPLDERFGIGMFEDDDYSLRVRNAGYRVVCAQDSFVHHWMKAAFSKISPSEYQDLFERNRRLFEEKWGRVWVRHSSRQAGGKASASHEDTTGARELAR